MKNIILRSSCNYTLKTFCFYIESIFKKLNIDYSIFFLPKKEEKITLLKSPHVYKKAKEQFKLETYKVVIKVEKNTGKFNNIVPFLMNKPKSIFIKLKF